MNKWNIGSPIFSIQKNSSLNIWHIGSPYFVEEQNSFIISGKVTLDDAEIEGALVVCFPDNNKTIIGSTLTDVNGDYEFRVSPDYSYHVNVEYEDINEGKKYNATSKWGIQPV